MSGQPSPGSVLGARYRLEQVVGRGGMADVYRGTDELLGRTVAVKLMRAGADTDGERVRIEAEMRTLARLRHPGLVTLFDASAGDDSSGDAPYLVMDFIAGPTLRQRTATGPLPAGEVAALGHDVALALRYVHQNGVVHRDVKPANILLEPPADSGLATARLTDFGIAQVAEHTRHTVQGTTVGTANYLSPEQARGEPLTAACDTYSFGLVLLEALTGELAFPGVGVEAAVARLHRDPAVPAHLGPQWQGLLRAMTAQRPGDRPEDSWVAQQLAELAGRPALAPEPATVPLAAVPPAAGAAVAPTLAGATALLTGPLPGDTALLESGHPRRRRRAGWLVGAGVAAVALVAVLVAVLAGSNSGSDPRAAGPSTSPDSTPRSSTTAPTSTAATTDYADVDGRLGRDLRRAETVVRSGGSGLGTLRADVQRLARAAAAEKYGTARSALDDVETDAAAAAAAGSLSETQLVKLRSIASSLESDLHKAATPSSSPTRSRTHEATKNKNTGPAGPAGPGKDKQTPPGQQKKSGGPPAGPGGP